MDIPEIIRINPECGVDDIFDSPHGSVWVVAVDVNGGVSILKSPNIDPYFFDSGTVAEYLGLPFEVDKAPGVYEWVCDYVEHRDWESGQVDDVTFEVREERLLYSV